MMCRLLYVKGEKEFLIKDHLEKFAIIAKNSREYQGHGWGCSFMKNNSWEHYKNIKPVWEDDLTRFQSSSLLVAHARSAFRDKDIRIENNMPFFSREIVFIFNGELHGVRIREQGRIGAEKIFNFILRHYRQDLFDAIHTGIKIISERTRYVRAMNVIMVSKNSACLSTQYNEDADYFTLFEKNKNGCHIICSEPYPDEQGWTAIDNRTIRRI